MIAIAAPTVSFEVSGRVRSRLELAVDADERDVARLEVQVARAHLDGVPQQFRDVQGLQPLPRGFALGGDRAREIGRRELPTVERGAVALPLVVELLLDLLELLRHFSARGEEL